MSDAIPQKRGRLLRGYDRICRGLLASVGSLRARRVRSMVLRGVLPLDEGLAELRRVASSIRPAGMLLDWGRERVDVSPAAEAEWFERAWWGLWAGELFRSVVHSPRLHARAMDIVDGPSTESLDRIDHRPGGLILAGAHLGPPNAVMAWLLHQPLTLLVWTAFPGFTGVQGLSSQARLVDATGVPDSLTAAYLHLRRGGVLFAAVDGGSGRRRIPCRRYKGDWQCATAIPVLSRRLALPSDCMLALWRGNRIAVTSEPVPPPDAGLDEEAWNRQWMESFWRSADGAVLASPENLRFLLFTADGGIRREVGL